MQSLTGLYLMARNVVPNGTLYDGHKCSPVRDKILVALIIKKFHWGAIGIQYQIISLNFILKFVQLILRAYGTPAAFLVFFGHRCVVPGGTLFIGHKCSP